jgi:type III secretory pathway component EscS
VLGLGGLIGQLCEDARALVRAEIQLAKSRTLALLRRSRAAIMLLALAGCVAFASVVALMLGLVLALAPLVGPTLAGVILLIAGLVVSGVLGWIAIHLLAGPPEKGAP